MKPINIDDINSIEELKSVLENLFPDGDFIVSMEIVKERLGFLPDIESLNKKFGDFAESCITTYFSIIALRYLNDTGAINKFIKK